MVTLYELLGKGKYLIKKITYLLVNKLSKIIIELVSTI